MAQQSGRRVAAAVLEITLLVTRLVTPEVRRRGPKQLSLSHMRALGFLDTNPDADLSAVADLFGLTPPSMSTLLGGVGRRGPVGRPCPPHQPPGPRARAF